jgi:enoyl-CoA hydratase/carnithine racemase
MAAWGAASLAAPDARRLEERTRALALELASLSGPALRLVKAETRVAGGLDPFLSFEARGQAACFHGRDLAEGLAAVRERRSPRFR